MVLQVIEWLDDKGDTMVHRWPQSGSGAITLGSQCVVRESQAAVFFRDGKAYDVLGPGRHTLTSLNIPGLTTAFSIPFGFKSPFRAEVVFVATKVFTNLKWGTTEPVVFRDAELGMVRLRAFGVFSPRIAEPQLFANKVVGTQGVFASERVEAFFREVIVARLNDCLGETLKTIFDLPKHYDELGSLVKARVLDDFGKYGLEVIDFLINAITPPAEVQKLMDERTGMAAIGDMNAYMQFKAAQAMTEAAKQPGGGAAAGMGAGVGVGMGMLIPGMLQQAQQQQQQQQKPAAPAAPAPAAPAGAAFCTSCGAALPAGAKFCPGCGGKLV
ncbi:MAG: SPFH domain-containing protein [Bacillota bacterium]